MKHLLASLILGIGTVLRWSWGTFLVLACLMCMVVMGHVALQSYRHNPHHALVVMGGVIGGVMMLVGGLALCEWLYTWARRVKDPNHGLGPLYR